MRRLMHLIRIVWLRWLVEQHDNELHDMQAQTAALARLMEASQHRRRARLLELAFAEVDLSRNTHQKES